jgi:hypothetical protein
MFSISVPGDDVCFVFCLRIERIKFSCDGVYHCIVKEDDLVDREDKYSFAVNASRKVVKRMKAVVGDGVSK